MRKTVKAKFENADSAEYAASAVIALDVGARCELQRLPDASGIYNGGVIPQSVSGTNIYTELFVPTFPENLSAADIARRGSAVLNVSCPADRLDKITETLIRNGGRILK